MSIFTRKNLLLLSGLIYLTGIQAQYHNVKGIIVDEATGEALIGATIIIDNTTTGTISNIDGKFELDNIPQNKISLSITYLSYEPASVNCDFTRNETLYTVIKLRPAKASLEEVTVIGKTEGQVKALLEQRTAVNIKNVVSSEQIKQFPDMNAAEVMQRIPGITVQRDQGEGRYVQLRGTPPELTNFNVNGEQISSPEGDVRYVGMDIIAADQIEIIEVTKVLTPDMDADGIAGNVNIITKSAKEGKPEVAASLANGYNNLMKKGNYQAQFSYGQRLNKFGFQLNSSYYLNNQGSHNMEYDYSRGPTLSQAQSGDTTIGEENFHILYSDIEYRHYTITRNRVGLSATIDYALNDKNLFYLRGMYNNYSDDETRRRITHSLSDANEPLIYRSAGIERDVRQRLKIQEITTVNLGATNTLYNNIALDYELSYSKATDEIPDYISAGFSQGLIGITVDKSDPQWPVVHYTDEEDSLNANNFGSYNFDGMTLRNNSVIDENYASKINLSIPYSIGDNQTGLIKIGGKVRFKNKQRDNNAQVFSEYERINIYAQPVTTLELANIVDDFYESNLLNHGYEMSMVPNADKMSEFYRENIQYFKYDEPSTWEDNYQEDYTAKENIYAAYIMIKHNINKLMLLGGFRYEQTDFEYTTQNAWLDLERGSPTRGILVKKDSTRYRTIPFLLPQVQLKYSVTSKSNIRAAATYTYSRPSFEDILPYRIENEDGDIKKGNPELDFPSSLNLDLLAETFLKSNGIISGGLYFKKIDNFVFKFVRRAHEGENFNQYGLKEITMPVNGIEAFVYGAEIQAQFKFDFLNGFFSNFGFFGTYTFTESSAYISKRYPQNENDIIYGYNDYEAEFFTSSNETEVISLPGQARHTANIALFYDTKKFYTKISSNYHSPFLMELGNDSGLDVYYDESLHVDFTANYQITPSLNCFVDIVNLTNAPLRYYMNSREFFKQQEYYSFWGRMGIKLTL